MQPKSKRGGANTNARMTNWRLLDKKTMIVEMEWQVGRHEGWAGEPNARSNHRMWLRPF